MRFYGELKKVEEQDDGSIKVFGIASTGARDDAGEIVTPDAMKAAIPDYLKFGAVREMHGPSAAGTALQCYVDDDGNTNLAAHIVDPVAVKKVKAGVYKGLSIGGKVLKRDPKDPTTITALKLHEISLVDRPANPEASINMWKIAETDAPEPAPVQKSSAEIIADVTAALKRAGETVAETRAMVADIRKQREDDETEQLLKFWPAGEPLTIETMIKVTRERAELIERLDKILREPMPAKCAARALLAVSRDEDAKGAAATPAPDVESVAKVIAAMPQEDRALLLMRAALSNPIQISR
jgi:hypothetical protein